MWRRKYCDPGSDDKPKLEVVTAVLPAIDSGSTEGEEVNVEPKGERNGEHDNLLLSPGDNLLSAVEVAAKLGLSNVPLTHSESLAFHKAFCGSSTITRVDLAKGQFNTLVVPNARNFALIKKVSGEVINNPT